MTWLLRNLSEYPWGIGKLFSQQRYLSDEIVSACLKPEVLGEIVYSRQEFIRPLLTRIEASEDSITTIKAAIALQYRNLSAESISRLVVLLAVKPASELAACKSRAAAIILAQQDQLPMRIMSANIFQIINQNKDESLLSHLLDNQPKELLHTHPRHNLQFRRSIHPGVYLEEIIFKFYK